MAESAELPTLYEYYTSGGITGGLSADQPHFLLNGREITLYSGAVHYFRVPPAYWRNRLRKARAAGLNCVETYVPWNLHQPTSAPIFDFGNANDDLSPFLDLKTFLEIAQEEDLLVIVRPGPYICSEWDFGGLPSWLLREDVKVRTKDPKFLGAAKQYLQALFELLVPLQFTKGGPIIAFQIENEYGNVNKVDISAGLEYLEALKDIFETCGVVELLFTSDTPSNGFTGTLPGVLATANFDREPVYELSLLKQHQPNKPLMVMEFWSGWFDHWAEKHHETDPDDFAKKVKEILDFGSSINFYMFHGGTSWGFLNGANLSSTSSDNASFQPDTSSYDYDAPLNEQGNYTRKYHLLRDIIIEHNTVKTRLPSLPTIQPLISIPRAKVTSRLSLGRILRQTPKVTSKELVPMEKLNINDNSGQSYGYIVYSKTVDVPPNSTLKIEGRVCDTVMVLLDGEIKSKPISTPKDLDEFGTWRVKDATLSLGANTRTNSRLDLVVENWGRVNYGDLGQFNQFKGLWQGKVLLNDRPLEDFDVYPLEFKREWIESLDGWEAASDSDGPALYRAELNNDGDFSDAFVDLRQWTKGIVIVNGFVLSRHCRLGPQQTAYLPAPLLRRGCNVVMVFEHFRPNDSINFVTTPIFDKLS